MGAEGHSAAATLKLKLKLTLRSSPGLRTDDCKATEAGCHGQAQAEAKLSVELWWRTAALQASLAAFVHAVPVYQPSALTLQHENAHCPSCSSALALDAMDKPASIGAHMIQVQAVGGFLGAALREGTPAEALKLQRMAGGMLQPTLDALFASATLQVLRVWACLLLGRCAASCIAHI